MFPLQVTSAKYWRVMSLTLSFYSKTN